MKKILLSSAVMVLLAFMVSCGGASKENATTDANATTEQSDVVETSELSVLQKYEEFVNKALPLIEDMKKGDAAAALEYNKLTEELAQFTNDNIEEIGNFTEEEAQKYQELAEKLATAFAAN